MSKAGAFLAGFAVAAAIAGAAWALVLAPKAKETDERLVAAERASLRAKRDATDAQGEAESERRRRLELEEQVTELKRAVTAAPPRAPGMGPKAHAPGDGLAPELWDRSRLNNAIIALSVSARPYSGSPQFPLIVRALKAHLDDSVVMLSKVMTSQLDNEMKSVCATLLGALADARGTQPLLDAWASATDPDLRQAVLQGLGNMPGDEPTPIFVAVWNDPASDAKARLYAIHGLARRKHAIAVAVAEGGAPGSTPPLRLQALQTLHAQALAGEWKDAELAKSFGKALRTADGDPQRKLILTTLEGFWSADSLPELDDFAASAASSDLKARAKKTADAIRSGAPRPQGAGITPTRPSMQGAPDPAEDTAPAEGPKEPPK